MFVILFLISGGHIHCLKVYAWILVVFEEFVANLL